MRPPAAGKTPSRSDAAGDDLERPKLWDELERLVGYRVSDYNFETALKQAALARTRPLDQEYDRLLAAKQLTTAGTIVRHGIGQVLGVR